MIIGLDELLILCSDFINDIDDFDVDVSTDFECYPTTNEIFISIVAPVNALTGFVDNLKTRTDIDDISEFTWSLLHEVGHCQTWNYLNDRTKNHCQNIKRKINRGSVPTATYYTLTDEKVATDWAIGYITENHKAVKAFDKMALDILTRIYLENEINLGG